MERFKVIRAMVWAIAAIIASQVILLIVMVRPSSTLLWFVIAMIVILVVYLTAISLGLLNFIKKNNPNT